MVLSAIKRIQIMIMASIAVPSEFRVVVFSSSIYLDLEVVETSKQT
jgi:hypothetical protein